MFDLFRNKNMLRIKNKTITSFEELKGQYEALMNEMAHLQRERDMKVDKIDRAYKAKINSVLRAADLVKNEMERAQKYINPNSKMSLIDFSKVNFDNPLDDIIPTPANVAKNAKKSDK